MSTKEQIHRLVDELPESEVLPARRFLEYLRSLRDDPLTRLLEDAPFDDEPESSEELGAVSEARGDLARGELVSDEDLWRRLGHEPKG